MAKDMLLKALLTALAVLVLPAYSTADTFTVTVPPGTDVTMRDPGAVIPVTITNEGPTKYIRSITFNIDTARYGFSPSTVPPSGWCVSSVTAGTITFALLQGSGACSSGSTASEIAPGGSLLFNITAVPAASPADVTDDTFSSVTVGAQGGFALSGSLPTWTRRSLDLDIVATPSSTGTGSSITVTMQVANRSTASQSGIVSVPSPPTPSTPIVTNTEGPYYGITLLDGDHTPSTAVITVDSTTDFPTSGTAKIGSEEICHTGKTATTLTGSTRGCNGTTAASHADNSIVYSSTPFALSPGESRAITYIYRADLTGTVYFTSRASNGAGTARSRSRSSNTVTVGNFTASVEVIPGRVISGQNVTVRMVAANNGSSALVNIVPSALTPCAGGATETIVSGPSPSLISSLAPGSSGVFEWTYAVTGPVGSAYCLSGSATADGPVVTNTAVSNSGTVSNYSVTVTPSTAASGATALTLTWTVYNGGGSGINSLSIDTPASGGNWNCSSVSIPSGWSGGCADPAVFTSGNPSSDIQASTSKSFSITFSATETVASDKDVPFPVTISVRGGGGFTSTVGTSVTMTVYGMTLTHSPGGPIYADGSAYYTMTATLTTGGSPVSGKVITFTSTNGSLTPATATTDSNGIATVSLVSPISTTDTSAIVTASYVNSTDTDAVSFTGWTGANLQYWGGVSPVTVDCGSSYSFTMNARNVGSASISLTTGSYFAFNDSSSGGSSVLIAYLDAPVTITPYPAPGSTVSLTFGSPASAGGGGGVSVPSAFVAGTYQPVASQTPPPESGLYFTDGAGTQRRTVTDNLTVGGPCGIVNLNIIDWHEFR